MKAWQERPIEEANLLNPAFCCVVLTSSIVGYASDKGYWMPFPLSFMILPLVLHKPTRDLLPLKTTTSFPAWIQKNASARVLFYERVVSLKPYTREALTFGLIHNWLAFQEDGNLQSIKKETDIDKYLRKLNDEAQECVKRSHFLGKWLAKAGSPQTVMTLWGIRP
ncbi:MAG: hypothetical protein HQK96_15045 [Nitrospirae bacterium]|nr:hypothetical protein [Nitrospirota bacterium]